MAAEHGPLTVAELDVLMARVRWALVRADESVAELLARGAGVEGFAVAGRELVTLRRALSDRLPAVAEWRRVLARRDLDERVQAGWSR